MRNSYFPLPGETPRDYRRRRYQEQLAEWRALSFVVGVEIRANPDACPSCSEWSGTYPLREAPVSPPEACTCHWRCLASVSPVYNSDPTRRPWHDSFDGDSSEVA